MKPKFKITPFRYPSGTKGWLVSGTLNGQQIRRRFSVKADALAERDSLELKRLNNDRGIIRITTKLSEAQESDAIAAIKLLGETSLVEAARFYLSNYIAADTTKLLREAVDEYQAQRTKDFQLGKIADWQHKRIYTELDRFCRYHPDARVNDILPSHIDAYRRGTLKSQNNQRSILNGFFKFALKRRYTTKNPCEETEHHEIPVSKGKAEILSVDQAEALMRYIETVDDGEMVPYFSLCLFAGIRPDWIHGEITRLTPGHINWEHGVISIDAAVSKVNEPRDVTMQPNLIQWLKSYPVEKFPILPARAAKRVSAVKAKFKLGHDVLRHTAISMFIAKYKSVGEAALQFGNSESMIKRHYLNVVGATAEKAERFWAIAPLSGQEAKVVPFNAYA